MTSASVSIPNFSVTSLCCCCTWSQKVTFGKRALSSGGGVLLGELESPLPSMLGTIMK
jgi:hypothetical protein